ncbi:putative phosphoesterase or phosphohydrolase [Acinetobacter phage vB_AbaM_CP14]|nr:putative phosphoesterase or phosphohydrolase [Acinetobacter phage vB_AbaM_CP14]
MYTLVLTITMFGWIWDDVRTVSVDNFKSLSSCQNAGEQLKKEHTKNFIGKATYTCVKK